MPEFDPNVLGEMLNRFAAQRGGGPTPYKKKMPRPGYQGSPRPRFTPAGPDQNGQPPATGQTLPQPGQPVTGAQSSGFHAAGGGNVPYPQANPNMGGRRAFTGAQGEGQFTPSGPADGGPMRTGPVNPNGPAAGGYGPMNNQGSGGQPIALAPEANTQPTGRTLIPGTMPRSGGQMGVGSTTPTARELFGRSGGDAPGATPPADGGVPGRPLNPGVSTFGGQQGGQDTAPPTARELFGRSGASQNPSL